jgi:hypothetical protein
MEFVPFGQGGIPPTAEKATKCRFPDNSMLTIGSILFKIDFKCRPPDLHIFNKS